MNNKFNVNVSKVAYALYKQNWINRHTNSQMRMDTIRDYYNFLLKNQKSNVKYISFEEYLMKFGYNGSIYVSYEDFYKSKYRNKKYMCNLLDIPELIEIYLEDLKQNYLEEDIENITIDENNEDIEL